MASRPVCGVLPAARWKGRAAAVGLALYAFWLVAEAGSDGSHGNAYTLDQESFDSFLEKQSQAGRPTLLMFHVGWCKVCQRVLPKFATASAVAVEKGLGMDFAHVDCTDDKTLCQRFEVKGYPTIKLFTPKVGAEPLGFRSPRTEQSFLKYAERMTQAPVRTFKDAKELEEAISNDSLAGFVIAAGEDGVPAAMSKVAEKWMDRHIFAVAPRLSDMLPKKEGESIPDGTTLAVLSVGAQQWSKWRAAGHKPKGMFAVGFYTGALDNVTAIEQWLGKNRFPGVWSLDENNFYEFTHASLRTAIVAVDVENVSTALEDKLKRLSDKFKDDFHFGVLNGFSWADELQDFNIAKHDLPRVLVTEDDFEVWIEDIQALRTESLEHDLRQLLAGAPLLRQSRGSVLSRAKFWLRESGRLAVKLQAFAARGKLQAGLVASGVIGVITVVLMLIWCLYSTCRILLFEDLGEWDDMPPAVQRMKKD